MDKETKEKLQEFVDFLEDKFDELEGFEVKLNHPIQEGQRQSYADIKSFVIYYLHKEEIIED